MQHFIMRENIARYLRLLSSEQHAGRRRSLEGLLAEEEARLADFLRENPRLRVGSGDPP